MKTNSVSKSNNDKKLKLFGVELDPSQLHETDRVTSEEEGSDESISSSSPSSISTEKPSTGKTPSSGEHPPPPPPSTAAAKKFVCSCCFKVFANPQALGGHQNAHKNEKVRQKKLQLQARKASCLNYYIIPSFNKFYDINSENLVDFSGSDPHWINDPSFPCLNKEVRINFGSESNSIRLDTNNHEYDVQFNNYVSLRQNKLKFSVTDGTRMKSRPIRGRSPPSPESKRICIRKGLDLHLGLGL